jgi:hypothetical protein
MATTIVRSRSTTTRLPARPGAAAARPGSARSVVSPARIELEVTRAQRELVATMQAHREASRTAFERSDRVRANRLRQQGQHITHMADQINLARKGLVSRHDISAHLDNVGRIYDDLAELRKRIDGDI